MAKAGAFAKKATTTARITEILSAGIAAHQRGSLDEARCLYNAALERDDRHPDCYHLLGVVALDSGEPETALGYLERAVELDEQQSSFYNSLGRTLERLDNGPAACQAYETGHIIDAADSTILANLANQYMKAGRFRKAKWAVGAITDLATAKVADLTRAGDVLFQLGDSKGALRIYDRALQSEPENAELHFSRSLALLHTGNFAEGWKEYEWRLQVPRLNARKYPWPRWDGSPAKEKTVLVHTEQGFGDTFQFCRFIPAVEKLVGKLIIGCHPTVRHFMSRLTAAGEIIVEGQSFAINKIDAEIPLASLPYTLGITEENLPFATEYLSADSIALQKWEQRLSTHSRPLIGFAWKGGGGYEFDDTRSVTLEDLGPLFDLPYTFISLQKPDPKLNYQAIEGRDNVVQFYSGFDDGPDAFADTAAVMSQLDLVIVPDCSLGHLAGAMNRPVWLIQTVLCEWRWPARLVDSPWYPSTRVFKPNKPGATRSVIARIRKELKKTYEDRNPGLSR